MAHFGTSFKPRSENGGSDSRKPQQPDARISRRLHLPRSGIQQREERSYLARVFGKFVEYQTRNVAEGLAAAFPQASAAVQLPLWTSILGVPKLLRCVHCRMENRVRLIPGWEASFITSQAGTNATAVERIEAVDLHLPHGLFRSPVLEYHAVSGNHRSHAIVAQAAMHENFLVGILADDSKELREDFVAWE